MVFLMPRDGGARSFTNRNSSMARDGRFEIRGVNPGSYLLAAHWYDQGKRFTGSQPLEVGNAAVDDLTLTLSPGFEIHGQVKLEGSTAVTGAVQLSLIPSNDVIFGSAVGGRTKPDGSFVLTNIAPDHYRVQVTGLPENCYVKAARLGESEMLETGAHLAAGAGPLDIFLRPAAGRVEGAVVDRAGQPAPGATVALVPDEPRRRRTDLFRTAVSDQNGRFSLKGIAPGDYHLYAWQEVEDGAWQDPEFLKPFENGAEAVSVEEKASLTVQLKLAAGEAR
jgi:hypothetical protein